MKTCCTSLTEINQWHKDAVYVIGLMARRNAYFTDWDISDIVGSPPEGCPFTVNDLLRKAESDKQIRYSGEDDLLLDGSYRRIWIGVK